MDAHQQFARNTRCNDCEYILCTKLQLIHKYILKIKKNNEHTKRRLVDHFVNLFDMNVFLYLSI